MRGKRNEPAFVAETAKFIANLRGISQQELGQITAENFFRFFKLALPNPDLQNQASPNRA
jgi:TatD DNase family protein